MFPPVQNPKNSFRFLEIPGRLQNQVCSRQKELKVKIPLMRGSKKHLIQLRYVQIVYTVLQSAKKSAEREIFPIRRDFRDGDLAVPCAFMIAARKTRGNTEKVPWRCHVE
jgi:hypothetical protein